MLKSCIRASLLNKFNNATLSYCCLRHYYFTTNKEKMQNQGFQNQKRDKDIRKWISIDQTNSPGYTFTLFNYNLLSQSLLEQHSYLYQSHNQSSLSWNARLNNIIGDIFKVNPTILCCQEVELQHLPQIQEKLSSMNYGLLYKKRTGYKPDGCAIFYKNDFFHLIEEHNVEFEQPGIEILNRENVAIIAKLCLKSNPSIQFIVATTHLLYNPRRQDIRLAQVQILLAELDRHAQVIDKNGQKKYLPVVLSGDFNLQPFTAPFNLIVNGSLSYAGLSSKTLQHQGQTSKQSISNGRSLLPIQLGISDECQHFHSEIKLYNSENNKIIQYEQDITLTKETVNSFQTGVLRHNFDFKSVYHQHDEEYVSTDQDNWILVDYIFYSDESRKSSNNTELKLLKYWSLPTSDFCRKLKLKIPNRYLGSDHLSLAAQFQLCVNDEQSEASKL